MHKQVFITGTGTDVGKTYVTGLLLKKLQESGKHAGYFKAAMSGNERNTDGMLIPGDALEVKTISGISQPLEDMCPYIYETAVSPHLASRIEGNPVQMQVVREAYRKVCSQYDYVVMEGSGGILCPIGYDEECIQLEDIVKEFNFTSVIVADAGLGTINSVVLTASYMQARHMPVSGILFNHFHPGNVMEEDNRFMCEQITGIPVVGCVKECDGELDMTIEQVESLFRP